ncbi:MAG: hydrolase Nlp/P60, partial [Eggerthellaceae bacterium]|nr:hydrolase Nlp/P60 [Eggerthellaceae bacterium]
MTEHIRTKKSAILASVLAVVLVCGLLPYPSARAYADPSLATKQAQAQEALDKLNAMQGELNAASDNYANAEEERANAQARVQQAQEQIEQETAKISEYQGELATRARSMYRTGGNTFLDVLLGASTFQEFATNWNMLETMNQNDAELVSKTKESRAKVQEAKVEYETQEAVATEKANEAKRIQDQAEAKTAEIQAVYNGLSSEVQELIRQEEAAREAADQAAAIQDIANNTAGDAAANNAGITNNPPANN